MEKVKLTKRQDEMLKNHRVNLVQLSQIANHPTTPTKKFDGYEVEPEYEKGDWVIRDDHGTIGIVTSVGDGYIEYDGGCADGVHFFRHATEEEIAQEKEERWWNKHGRDVGEYRENDIVSHDDNTWGGIYIVYSNTYGHDAFRNRLIRVCNRHMHKGKKLSFQANELKVI